MITKKQEAILNKTADILDKLAEKCGGPGGKPGPCPGGGTGNPAAAGAVDKPSSGSVLSRSEGKLEQSLTFASKTHERLQDAEAKKLVPKSIKTRITAEWGGVLNTKSPIEDIQKSFVESGWKHTHSVQQTQQYGRLKMDQFQKDGVIAQVDNQSFNKTGWTHTISFYRPRTNQND